jgi:hypothetical protein
MRHFTVWEWVDFAGGLDAPAVRSAMDAHLAGCSKCRQTVQALRAVSQLAHRENAYEPPDHAVRYAQALYPLYRPEKSGIARLIAHLVHDTASVPLPAGIRAEDRLSRHLVYQADSYYLDLQLEYQPSGRVTLIGQLADQGAPAINTANVPVCLMEGSTLMAMTVCNHLGEFHLECAPSRNLRLRLPLPAAGKQVEVPLSDLHPDYHQPLRSAKVVRRQTRRRSNGG